MQTHHKNQQQQKQQQKQQLEQQTEHLKQQQQQPQGPIDSPKNNQHEQEDRMLNKQHRADLQNQNMHGNHRE
ncbi:hypothetical protein [Acinetobacter indicus]|uniref:hypothetical protein n=1 Tax=Acinetobacter indicus TaxID=756892 RepID=UPI000948F92E|nr:hypothetical protein [Acinetobacter indicus]MDM1290357.1 hypothetical protein [Acinetobacter indicus]MDM1320444.1 hypothetical protein [Acinetobacter indicus]MDM1332194.1 hypothetical protein [Acinetobacter indicus]QIZ57896.1 hypothetical protein FK537_01320 [Acinetobacter indicus]